MVAQESEREGEEQQAEDEVFLEGFRCQELAESSGVAASFVLVCCLLGRHFPPKHGRVVVQWLSMEPWLSSWTPWGWDKMAAIHRKTNWIGIFVKPHKCLGGWASRTVWLRKTDSSGLFEFEKCSCMKMFIFWLKFWVKFVPKGPIESVPALVQIMAWYRTGNKSLSEPMMAYLCITRPNELTHCPRDVAII